MSPKLHRKELKQDEIRDKIGEAVRSVSLHQREVLYIIGIIVAIGLIAAMWFYYEKRQQAQSQYELGLALQKFNAPVNFQPDPANPEAGKPRFTYKNETEKYRDALRSFQQIIQKYGNTAAADFSRYGAGVCSFYLKDYKKAEEFLKESAKVSDRSLLFYLSRMALANLYAAQGQQQQAVALLKESLEHDKRKVVPPENILLQLAQIYADSGKIKEARETYQKIVNEYKESPVSYQAQSRLTELKE
jgi:tetratricopeptide (TPR) repeat protein